MALVDLEYVQCNVRDGFILNPNPKVVNGIIKGINRCDGDCPCDNDADDVHCPCSNYRLHDHCCCTLYVHGRNGISDEDYRRKTNQLAVLDELMKEFKYGTNLDTAYNSIKSVCCEYEK